MGKLNHRIAPDVKKDILKRVKEDGIPVAEAAKDHGIHESTIYGWLQKGVTSAPSWSEYAKAQKKVRELTEIIGELTIRLSETQKKT
jgi:transposase-like protein